jgi:hypothetical protein
LFLHIFGDEVCVDFRAGSIFQDEKLQAYCSEHERNAGGDEENVR